MSIQFKDWPQEEKPREKLIAHGERALTDSELISIILNTGGRKDMNVVEQARTILNHFDGPAGLARAGLGELLDFKGLGFAKVSQLKAAIELGRRSFTNENTGIVLISPEDVYNFYKPKIGSETVEVFRVAFLDVKKRLKRERMIYRGMSNQSPARIKEIFALALKESADSIICVHNHPSGDPKPSASDIRVTQQLFLAGQLMGISLIDHVIITDNSFISMADEGWLDIEMESM